MSWSIPKLASLLDLQRRGTEELVYLFCDGLYLSIECEDEWKDGAFLRIKIVAEDFPLFLHSVFGNSNYLAARHPRVTSGAASEYLTITTVEFACEDGKDLLWLAGEPVRVDRFCEIIKGVSSWKTFYRDLYIGQNKFFLWLEGFWVWVFLVARMKFTGSEVDNFLSGSEFKSIRRRWGGEQHFTAVEEAELFLILSE